MTNLLFISYSSKISSNHVNVALPYVWLLTSSVLSATSKQCFELASSVSSTTSKQCFEQPTASSLVCSLIFIKYKSLNISKNEHFQLRKCSFFFLKTKKGKPCGLPLSYLRFFFAFFILLAMRFMDCFIANSPILPLSPPPNI